MAADSKQDLKLGFGYDPVGDLVDLASGDTQVKLQYDALGRLTQFKDAPSGATIDQYTYDATGNRTSFSNAAGTVPYGYPADSHRLTSVGGELRTYDAMGNTTSIGGTDREFVYDERGRMAQVKRSGAVAQDYLYNARGEQVARLGGADAGLLLYDEAGHSLGDYDAAGLSGQQVIWMDDAPVGLLGDGALSYVEPDHLGTPRVVADPVRDVAVWGWDLKGEAFGSDAPKEDVDSDGHSVGIDLRFPGQIYSAQTFLYQNYFRDLDPATGRYIQADPLGLGGGVSAFGYVGGDTLSSIDRFGLVDQSSPWSVGWEWLTGTGPRHHNFNDGDPFAEMLRQHSNIQRLRARACDGALPPSGKWDYSVSGWRGVPLYLHDYSNVLTGGRTGNLAVTFMGSYKVRYRVDGDSLILQATNSSSIQSATHPPVIGYTKWWSDNIGDPLNRWRATGPMSEVTQTFNLTFDLSKCGCGE